MRVRSERVQQGPGTMYANRPLPRHVILKFQNTGDRGKESHTKGQDVEQLQTSLKQHKMLDEKVTMPSKF